MLLLNSCCSSTSKLKKNESLINNRTKGVGGGKRFLFFSSVFFYITTCFSFWCWKKMKKRENGKKSKSSWKSKEARDEMKRETARLQLEKEKSSTVKVFMKEVSFWLYFRGESGFFFKTSCCLWSEKVAFSLVQQLHAWIRKRFWLTRDSWLVQNQKCTVTAVGFQDTSEPAVDSKVALKQQAAGKWEIIRREKREREREEKRKREKDRQDFASHLKRVNE